MQFSGNLDSNIRYHINGGYLGEHIQKRKQWSDLVWDTIDWNAFGQHLCSMDMRHQPAHLKLIHGLLPLGTRRFVISSVPDPQLKLCPCCQLRESKTNYIG
jgi:hypothetical protein